MTGDPVTVSLPDESRTGRAVDCSDRDLAPEHVAAAVRRSPPPESTGGDTRSLRVECPAPGPVHQHVGLVAPSVSVRIRPALAAAARSRGAETPVDGDIRSVREDLAGHDVPAGPDLAAARRRLAGTESAVTEARERVAALRGRIQATRAEGRDASDLEAELAEATRRLSEQETERAAAREALEMARTEARETRDARDRQRRLEDRLANLERTARERLVEAVRDPFAAAVEAAPDSGGREDSSEAADDDTVGTTDDGTVETTDDDTAGLTGADPLAADGVTAALAVTRVAEMRTAVVLAVDRFASPADAAGWLDAPVVRVSRPE